MMREKLITEMSAEEFAEVIETFITRETKGMGEVGAPLFYEVLEEIFAQPDQLSVMEDVRRPVSATPKGSETLVTLAVQVYNDSHCAYMSQHLSRKDSSDGSNLKCH